VWRGGDPVNASIGQGDIQATPLQIANAYATVANGGTVWWPHIGKTIRSADGETVEQVAPTVVRTIDAPPEHWAELQQGLKDVVMGSRGTAKSPFTGFPLETIPVAGKTGTAEAGSKVPYSWFAAYAPADAPEYVVVAMVEQGGGGSQTSAPIVRRILDAIYDLPIEPFEAGPGNILD
jgi:penicillin-binding protein 2